MTGSKSIRPSSAFLWTVACATLVGLILAAWNITKPGLYYDETLFANAALGGATGNFVKLRIAGVPVLLMDYIGALKAWIYYPIFKILPVNELTIRLPAIVFALAGGLASVGALRTFFGRAAAIIGAFLILLDPALLTASRLDWGPNALMFFFRGLLVFSFARWFRSGLPRWIWLGFFAGVAGIFDKLDFLWIAYALAAAGLLVVPGRLWRFARLHPFHASAFAILGGGILAFATLRAVGLSTGMGEPGPADWTKRWHEAMWLLHITFIGGGPLEFVSGNSLRLWWMLPSYGLGVLGAIVGGGRWQESDFRQAWLFLAAMAVMVVGMFIVTRSATGPHHAVLAAGFFQMLLAPLVAQGLTKRGAGWRKRGSRVLAAATAAILIVAMIAGNVTCLRAFRTPMNPNWDPANTAAAYFAARHPEAHFITTDWGMGTQIIAVSRAKVSLDDAWPAFVRLDSAASALSHLDRTKNNYLITRLPGFQTFPDNRANLLAGLARDRIDFKSALVLPSYEGRPMIEVLLVPKLR